MSLPKIDLSKYEKPSQFLRLSQGDNRLRILSEPYMYQVVGKKTARGYVRQILEDGVEVKEFLKDVKPKLTYGFVVFSFVDEHFHVLETGTMLGHPLTELVKAKFPEEYKALDIIVHRTGEKLQTEYTCKYADKSLLLPKGISKDSAEFRYILSYFEGL